ncbi:MAG: hypothetical protein HC824_13310 [Synechococcales cyanobacterium RM1_1_8]|nr:hypothetical protein [Synechococcales cyanobacterium RM1_1_8]
MFVLLEHLELLAFKKMKRFNFFLVSCFGLSMSLSGLSEAVMAAGFDPETIPGTGEEVIVDRSCVSGAALDKAGKPTAAAVHACKRRIRTFDWAYWTQPEVADGGVCRERDGSIVCLAPESKDYLRW